MAKSQDLSKIRQPANNEESRTRQMINLAINNAEDQLRSGTASSQVITHYLKLGSPEEALRTQKLQMEINLIQAKIEAIKSAQSFEETAKAALDAMREYSGHGTSDD